MEIRAEFDPADWSRITAMPMLVGMAVTAADPGGLWGAVKESTAMTTAVLRGEPGGNALIEAVVAGFAAPETRSTVSDILRQEIKGRQPAEVVEALVTELERLATLIASKVPDLAPGFHAWLMDVAQKVAEAGTEGGFLGFGGEKVSAAEVAALTRIRTALGLSAPGAA